MLPEGELRSKVLKYEEFASNKLKPQLIEVNKARETLSEELGKYLQLRTTLEMMRE